MTGKFAIVNTRILGLHPRAVRTSSNGNLVAISDGSWMIARAGQAWPELYDTENSAWAEIERREAQCAHQFTMTSHEEARCELCGMIKFVPDL